MQQLTANTGIADDNPTWSPDSSMIAFSSNRDSDGDIFDMRADGSAVHVLVAGVSDGTARPPGVHKRAKMFPGLASRAKLR